jgi:uncharacterized protein (TIGR03086 family)
MAEIVDRITPEQSAWPTPCGGWNVHRLLCHVVAMVWRVTVIGRGEPPFATPSSMAADPGVDWPPLLSAMTEELWSVWGRDEALRVTVVVPPGVMVNGDGALAHYVTEFLVHGWDLAAATGQDREGPVEVAESALALARIRVPGTPRGGPAPFGQVCPAPAGAGPTTRLAAWLGRSMPVAAPLTA